MKTVFLTFLLALIFGSFLAVNAEITPNFPGQQPILVDANTGSSVYTGSVLPCNYDFYAIQTFTNVQPGDYMRIVFSQSPDSNYPTDDGVLYLSHSNYTNLENELASNANIVDTLGNLPGPYNYDYYCNGSSCTIELSCEFTNSTYYLAIYGGQQGIISYNFQVFSNAAKVQSLPLNTPTSVYGAQRPTQPPVARVYDYQYFSINVPESDFVEGTYFVVNISRVSAPGLTMRLLYGDIPIKAVDHGVLDSSEQTDCVYGNCVNTTVVSGARYFDYPVASTPRVPCACTTFAQNIGIGIQLTCNITVDPCNMQYGTWYVSLELPPRAAPENPADTTGIVSYSIAAYLVQPTVTVLTKNVTEKAYVEPERMTHFKVNVPSSDVVVDQTHLFVQVSNIRGGFVNIYIHQGLVGEIDNLAGGSEACVPSNYTCTTRDACNLVIQKCLFSAGTWYIGVEIATDSTGNLLIDNVDRLPISFTIRATWIQDTPAVPLIAGIPVSAYVGEALYDFYVLDVPATVDSWLNIELYANANDTEIILSVLSGSLPGGECYSRPDFYCITGDLRGIQVQGGPQSAYALSNVQRESCSFTIQTCELTPGPLYFSVYGHHIGYTAYGDNTFYQIPVHYTLNVNFDVATALDNAVAYTERVHEQQYNHYYIRADDVDQGSFLSVEVTNIQHGIPQSVQVFVNYNFLAGNCPCYDHLYNCTGSLEPGCNYNPATNAITANSFPSENQQVNTYCTVIVPPCDFRSGVWYVSVLGENADLVHHTTPIGYTLTVTVQSAPKISPLIVGQTIADEAPQFNITNQYTHYKLGAVPIPNHDLVFKLTYVQNQNFLGFHDNSYDSLVLFVNSNGVAGSSCYDYSCTANVQGFSYCTIVIPHCDWNTNTDYFVAVQGNYQTPFIARYTLSATVEEIAPTVLYSGVPVHDKVPEFRFKHYYVEIVNVTRDRDLLIDLYTNSDQDTITAFINVDDKAGNICGFNYFDSCLTSSSCFFQIQGCQLEQNAKYFISVLGSTHQFFDIAVEYTITATLAKTVTYLESGDPFTNHIQVGQIQHYLYVSQIPVTGQFLKLTVDNVQHGSVQVYYNFDGLAGLCPCYDFIQTCYATSDYSTISGSTTNNWCEINIPTCEFGVGNYYFSIVGLENFSPVAPVYETKVGYTVEIDLISSAVYAPNVAVGFSSNNTVANQYVANDRYNHYQIDITNEQFNAGYHLIVEFSNVIDGALYVYFSNDIPADANVQCQVAEICTSGLGTGGYCNWQVPYCLTTPGRHYITVQGITGRLKAEYNVIFYLDTPLNVTSNPTFTLDNYIATGQSFNSTSGNLTVVHQSNDEPFGWVKFIQLENVTLSDTDNGEILEVFFYGVQNNAGESLAFNVYLWPESPAGAHECCTDGTTPSQVGSCENAPCSNTVPTTIYNPGFIGATTSGNGIPSTGTPGNHSDNVISHLCFPTDVGTGGDPTNGQTPFYGARCTVRVWACDLHRAQNSSSSETWWMTVVPVAAPNPDATPLSGLTYQVDWRIRNIRIDPTTGSIGSHDLTSYINDANQTTPVFNSTTVNSESEEFASFVVDLTTNTTDTRLHKLVIQTYFVSGVGEVYIQQDTFANPLDCNAYICTSSEDCSNQYRFIVPPCCASTSKYYITVRNLGGAGSSVSFYFRISDVLSEGNATIVQANILNDFFVYNDTSVNVTNANGVNGGVFGDSYVFYAINVTQNAISNGEYLIINTTKVPGSNGSPLNVYVRYAALAGENTVDGYFPNGEGCFNYQYECSISQDNQICIIQIIGCDLLPGLWYVSVYNPNFNLTGTVVNNADYAIEIYYQPIRNITINSFVQDSFSPNGTAYVLYELDVSPQDIGVGTEAFYTNFLRVTLSEVSTTGNVDFFFNYGSFAGDRNDTFAACYGGYSHLSCNSASSCYFDLLPCGGSGTTYSNAVQEFLVSGRYYIALRVTGSATYTINATIYSTTYTQLEPTLYEIDINTNTYNTTWSYSYTGGLYDPTDENTAGVFRYYANVSDVSDQRTYLIVNITSDDGGNFNGPITLDVWRRCVQYTCQITTSQGWCTIDALGLAPCSVESGFYYFRVNNPSLTPFTLNMYQEQTSVQTIINGQTITDVIYSDFYQAYYYEAANVTYASTLTVNISTSCGTLEAWINSDYIGGPSADITTNPSSCSIAHCAGNPCIIQLDTCQFSQRGYWITLRGNAQTFPADFNQNIDLPVTYSIYVEQLNVNLTQIYRNQPVVVDYLSTLNQQPAYFFFDIETSAALTLVNFKLSIPQNGNGYVTGADASLFITADYPVGFSTTCPAEYSCSIVSGSSMCFVQVSRCIEKGTRYYIFADAPHGFVVLAQFEETPIQMITTGALYQGTINALASYAEMEQIFVTNTQYYRYDFNAYQTRNFLFSAMVSNVQHGTVALSVFYSKSNYIPNALCAPDVLLRCTASDISADNYCFVQVTQCDIESFYYDGFSPFSIFISVEGILQTCELHSIAYSLQIEEIVQPETFNVNSGDNCEVVAQGDYNFFRLDPATVSRPQDTLLEVVVKDVVPTNSVLTFQLSDSAGVPTTQCYGLQNVMDFSLASEYNTLLTCGFSSAQFSIYAAGNSSNYGNDVQYTISVTEVPIKTVQLTDGVVYNADDNVTAACVHDFDYYYFRTPARGSSGFVRFVLMSDFEVTAYANKQYIGGPSCYDVDYCSSVGATSSCILFDLCDTINLDYYVTVYATGPYTIVAHYEPETQALSVNVPLSDSVTEGDARLYSVQIPTGANTVGNRLSIEISGIEYGSVQALINYENQAGYSLIDGQQSYCAMSNITVSAIDNTTNYGVLVVDSCNYQSGTYYITILGQSSFINNCQNISYILTATIESYNIVPTNLTVNVFNIGNSIDVFALDAYTTQYDAIQYFQFTPLYRNTTTVGTVRVANVQGGVLAVYVSEQFLATAPIVQSYGNIADPYTSHIIVSGYFNESFVNFNVLPNFATGCGDGSCAFGCCQTGFEASSSCGIAVFPDQWVYTTNYIAVIPLYQFQDGVPITYDIIVEQQLQYTPITPNTNVIRNFTNNNADALFFAGKTRGQESVRVRTQVINGDYVIVVVSDNTNPLNATWARTTVCDGRFYDQPWRCDINILTRGYHPGAYIENFFIVVYGSNATFSLSYLAGRDNCHDFSGTGKREGLSFCENLVPYTVSSAYDYSALDIAAEYLFYELYDQFRVQPCWTGVTKECNATLQRFACYENFHRCDAAGFAVGTCRRACEAVVYECANWFESVNIERFNCTSNRYLDEYTVCTGNIESNFFDYPNYPNKLFQDPNDIAYNVGAPYNAVSPLAFSSALVIFATIFSTLFF